MVSGVWRMTIDVQYKVVDVRPKGVSLRVCALEYRPPLLLVALDELSDPRSTSMRHAVNPLIDPS